MQKPQGTFVVSLDFELFWGMTDKSTLAEYGPRVLGEREATPGILALFEKYGIHATWATVGMLAFETRDELIRALPESRPAYADARLSTYEYLKQGAVGKNEEEDPYHFGSSLIRQILATPNQELASHTFSHYYCLEEGQDSGTFRADLEASIRALSRYGRKITSLVLPRNQWREDYLSVCRELGIKVFRGNQEHSMYEARAENRQINPFMRACRLLDQYLPLSGSNTYGQEEMTRYEIVNVPASMFLRPYHPALAGIEWMRRWRLARAMTYAAKKGRLFHLWWHPHNFGSNIKDNLTTLEYLLRHFAKLKEQYGMQSLAMGEVATSI